MNAQKLFNHLFGALFAILILLLAACQPAALVTDPQPTQVPTQPSATPALTTTQAPVQPTQTPSGTSGKVILDLSGVLQSMTEETVPAMSSAGGPWWQAAPQYRLLTLHGYPVTGRSQEPQIFIYRVSDLAAANENMGKAASELQALLGAHKAGDLLPFLPLSGDTQVMHAQVVYLDFKSGQGVRFLTQFNNGIAPVNNSQLIYAFQGLTSDGQYYIAAVFPVTHPELPAGPEINAQQVNDPQAYLTSTVSLLNQASAGSFTPDLAKLDALIASLEIK